MFYCICLHCLVSPVFQTLPFDVKRALDLTTDKEVIQTPLHIHLKELEIPNLTKKKEKITFTAPLPEFYSQTLDLLKLADGDLR